MTDNLRRQVLEDLTVPEPVRKALERGLPLDEIRIDGVGQWWHNGVLIEHDRIIKLFSRSVTVTEGGTFVLQIGPYTYPIVVDDTPLFVATAIVDEAAGEVRARLNDGTEERLDLATLDCEPDGRLKVRVKDGHLNARFLRRAFHDLIDYLDETSDGYVLRVGETTINL